MADHPQPPVSPATGLGNVSGKSPFAAGDAKTKSNAIDVPSISLPKGGGAIKGIDEKFQVNAVNGTANFSIPLPVTDARGFSPSLAISYSSGGGNGIFGLGWSLGLPSISRKTDKKLPEYLDAIDSDTYLLSDAEDLVPEFKKNALGVFLKDGNGDYVVNETARSWFGANYKVRCYRPRIEGLFSRIERWTDIVSGMIHWRTISKTNVTSIFGKKEAARVADPTDAKRIFEWRLEFTFDDKGNCIVYDHKVEDWAGLPNALHNRNRGLGQGQGMPCPYGNGYLKRVLYGPRVPYLGQGEAYSIDVADYCFETVLDYGEHDLVNAPFPEVKDWDFRADAFSNYRAGFEVRTTRLCKRILHSHRFAELPGGVSLVKSLDFVYGDNGADGFTFLQSFRSKGYIKQANGTYTSKAFPPMEFDYQTHAWDREVHALDEESLRNAPIGTSNGGYQFVDLYSEGLSGILSEQAGGWYYKSNLGGGKFGSAQLVAAKPAVEGLGQQWKLMDLEGNGQKQLVQTDAEPKGFFELETGIGGGESSLSPRKSPRGWEPFLSMPNHASGAHAKMIDLTGDGLADILLSEQNGFRWHASLGKIGFGDAQSVVHDLDEEMSPMLVFADKQQSIFLADMSGDGLVDIVRIQNGEVCYWPNLGYARFGAKVSLDNAPQFDHPDQFNSQYIKLADLDGSGTSDIVYLGRNRFSIYLNCQGNRLADAVEVAPFPEIHQAVDIDVTDLLGTGMACIVWNSKLSKDAQQPTLYIDLMQSKKPHLMVGYRNNLGKEVALEYQCSTAYYLADKAAGTPWITKLHFPVHCLAKTTVQDRITGAKVVSSYTYHHGYYDPAEREFRGFGRVDQVDAEEFEDWAKGNAGQFADATLYQTPVLQKSWHHTGAFLEREIILDQFAEEYWYKVLEAEGVVVAHNETKLPDARLIAATGIDPNLLANLPADELREAFRACKSMGLRTETFALDAPVLNPSPAEKELQLTPFAVGTHNCLIELVQPRGKNRHAVFVVKESEAIQYQYERNVADPRVSHTLNVVVDEYGNVLEAATVTYGRKTAQGGLPSETQTVQGKTLYTYTKNTFTKDVVGLDSYRQRMPAETQTYELKGVSKVGARHAVEDFVNILNVANLVPYEDIAHEPAPNTSQKRLLEHSRNVYLSDDLVTPLALGELASLGMSYESYQLAYTPSLLADLFGVKIPDPELLMPLGKFTHLSGDANWWVRSGTMQYLGLGETPAVAKSRFYVPISYTDAFGAKTKVKYYGTQFLLVEELEDALLNTTKVAAFNFRTLAPQRMQDLNGNFTEALTDELGMLKAMAVFGKGNEADDLSGLQAFDSPAEAALVQNFLTAADSAVLQTHAKSLLQHATVRMVYDLGAYMNSGGLRPVVAATVAREEHSAQNPNSPVQISFEYSNGMGKVAMKKTQAEPGLAKQVVVQNDGSYVVNTVDTGAKLRWIGNGRAILNNKGKPVKQYEPYFSVTPQYENQRELVETGVSPTLYYDAVGRVAKTVFPDGSLSRAVFTAWSKAEWDPNDTTADADCRWYLDRVGHLIDAELIAAGKDPALEEQAAHQAFAHAGTAREQYLDSLGRPILTIDRQRNVDTSADELVHTHSKVDIEGNLRAVVDELDNEVVAYKYDLLGHPVYQKSMDAGQRWLLSDLLEKPLRTWDEREHEFRYEYDELHRPTKGIVLGGDGAVALNHVFDRIFYGESLVAADRSNLAAVMALNVLGKTTRHYDTGGLLAMPAYDFSGNATSTVRSLCIDYKSVANWTDGNLVNALEVNSFTFQAQYDALGRIRQQTAPDLSVITPSYNEAGLLTGEAVAHADAGVTTTYIKDIDYNEKGRRKRIVYGNDVITHFSYDALTLRLNALVTRRANNSLLQDLRYTYDAVGNVTHIHDHAVATTFYGNMMVEPASAYVYDALYRLVDATGRENNVALAFTNCDNWDDRAFLQQLNPGAGINALQYREKYRYDAVGNIRQLHHIAVGNSWTRSYRYNNNDVDRLALGISPLVPKNNRLLTTAVGGQTMAYTHHAQHGFLTQLPHLEGLDWNFKEEVVRTVRQACTDDNVPVTTYYQYDGQGKRLRKVTENAAAQGNAPTKKEERIYVDGYELYTKFTGTNAGLQRVCLSLMDAGHRFVMAETRLHVNDGSPQHLVRYQLHNHIGSACLELEGSNAADVISYEEFHPFGTTAFQLMNNVVKAAAKRYRYSGMERDEETGLSYHGARYYISWLGRWLSADPIGINDGVNVYAYAHCNPMVLNDPGGTQATPPATPRDPYALPSFSYLPFHSQFTYTTPGVAGLGASTPLESVTSAHAEFRAQGLFHTPDFSLSVPALTMGRLDVSRDSATGDVHVDTTALGVLGGVGGDINANAVVRGSFDLRSPGDLSVAGIPRFVGANPDAVSGRGTFSGQVNAGTFTLGNFTGNFSVAGRATTFSTDISAIGGVATLHLDGSVVGEGDGNASVNASGTLGLLYASRLHLDVNGTVNPSEGSYDLRASAYGYVFPATFVAGDATASSRTGFTARAITVGITGAPKVNLTDNPAPMGPETRIGPGPAPELTTSAPGIGPVPPPDPWVPGGLLLGVAGFRFRQGNLETFSFGVFPDFKNLTTNFQIGGTLQLAF